MQNIDPIFILQPAVVIAISSGLLVYWYIKRRFHPMVLIYSLIAYAVAIALKYAVQIPTYSFVSANFGQHSVGLGVYFGLQTVFFEVGLAYAVAWHAVKQGKLAAKDCEAYGSGLAFWENAVLLSALSLINLIAIYSVLSQNTPLAQTVYSQISGNAPNLFDPTSKALVSVGLGTWERISSILIHFAWGYLCLFAAVRKKKRLFLIALPMGFVDFLVPFAQPGNLVFFEGVVFALAILSVVVAWYAVKRTGAGPEGVRGQAGA